ncbi:hypothetical protein RvY_03553 [Ramazzottius varieornatus]|uniref:Uncharacterized protein n=1 Tax=Ramazzottius varieornatus TaxID=947166 RepID=A0A1D1UXU7_RAMVA|nr:hypothetical protein RvY_03553 [Ramazzottius varieornatus]
MITLVFKCPGIFSRLMMMPFFLATLFLNSCFHQDLNLVHQLFVVPVDVCLSLCPSKWAMADLKEAGSCKCCSVRTNSTTELLLYTVIVLLLWKPSSEAFLYRRYPLTGLFSSSDSLSPLTTTRAATTTTTTQLPSADVAVSSEERHSTIRSYESRKAIPPVPPQIRWFIRSNPPTVVALITSSAKGVSAN